MARAYDLIVIGSGTAAQVASYQMASAGWKVAVVDHRQIPPIAKVGLGEDELRNNGIKFQIKSAKAMGGRKVRRFGAPGYGAGAARSL